MLAMSPTAIDQCIAPPRNRNVFPGLYRWCSLYIFQVSGYSIYLGDAKHEFLLVDFRVAWPNSPHLPFHWPCPTDLRSQHCVSWAFHIPWIVGMTSLEFVRFLGLATTLRARKSTLRGSWEADILPKPAATSNPSRMVLFPLWIPRTSQWNEHKSAAYLHVYCLHMFNYVFCGERSNRKDHES